MRSNETLDLSGSPAEIYERYLVPRFFLPWARDLVEVVAPKPGEHALDVACGTGAVTRLVAEGVPHPVTWTLVRHEKVGFRGIPR
jgi:trans-aconitate methyltransferase